MNLDIRIQNFGKVTDAKIKLRQFTVISGPNSSGKSFITKSLYSIFHALNDEITLKFLQDSLERISQFSQMVETNLSRPSQDEMKHLEKASLFVESIYEELYSLDSVTLSEEAFLMINIGGYVDNLNYHIKSLYEIIQNKGRKFQRVQEDLEFLRREANTLSSFVSDNEKFYVSELTNRIKTALIENFQVSSLKELINFYHSDKDSVFDLGIGNFSITSDIGGIQYEFQNDGIENLQRLDRIVYLESPIYWKLKNSLYKIRLDRLRLNLNRRGQSGGLLLGVPEYFYDLLELLESSFVSSDGDNGIAKQFFERIQKILNGKLLLSSRGEMQFQENGTDKKINLNATASGIVNLGMIGLLLEKGLLSPGSMIFIDEPEVNLHPEWQHSMLDILFELSKLGVNVIIATHSIDMAYKLESLIKENPKLLEDDFFGINHLEKGGGSFVCDDVLQVVRKIKDDLGGPYAELYRSQSMNISGF